MRASSLVTVVFLVTTAWAGGYQGALERLMLFYAYGIDELNPEAEQRLGFQCEEWIESSKTCKGNKWKRCLGRSQGRCNFNELMKFLGKVGNAKPNLVGPAGADQNTATPDIEETAKNVFNDRNGKLSNFSSWKAMKGADGVWNHFLADLNQLVSSASANHRNPGNERLFQGFKAAVEQVRTARIGDHGPFVIEEAREQLGKPYDMDIKLIDLGSNPAKPAVKWQTVDWEATLQAANAKGIPDAAGKISWVQSNFYSGGSPAQHRAVIQSYDELIHSC